MVEGTQYQISDLHENTNLEFKDNIMITYVQNVNSSSSTFTKY
jgi:hypothetical protein